MFIMFFYKNYKLDGVESQSALQNGCSYLRSQNCSKLNGYSLTPVEYNICMYICMCTDMKSTNHRELRRNVNVYNLLILKPPLGF